MGVLQSAVDDITWIVREVPGLGRYCMVMCLAAGSQVASSLTGDLCELGAADHCFGKENLTSKDHFWKGSCQSLLV
ncbi:UNVERIFIED_CONTAM: hypothetical protein Sradi_5239100 [Sesamum radiatum]|uniref:Uncharacterized protein n=1 Tax=Sesamum radiatum TaxID=300843 RepID=A0AAW2LNL2_SESRA